jgi:hypothetical protein
MVSRHDNLARIIPVSTREVRSVTPRQAEVEHAESVCAAAFEDII